MATVDLLHDLVRHWARAEPASAASYVESLPQTEAKRETMHEIAKAWAATDPESAVRWADGISENVNWRSSIDGVANELAQVDPQRAAAFAASLDESDLRRSVLDTVASIWSEQDLAAARDWVNGLPGTDRIAASRGLLGTLSEHDPVSAARLFEELVADVSDVGGEDVRHVVGHIAERWSELDAPGAADWVNDLSANDDVKRHAVESIAERWVHANAGEASRWIEGLSRGMVRDIATERMVDYLTDVDPVSALEWTEHVSDQGHQTEMLRHVFEHWRREDSVAARASFDAISMSAEQREEIGGVFE